MTLHRHKFAPFVLVISFGVALALLLLAAWWCYRPGLSGDFLFDDFGNLPTLGATGPIDNAAALARYLTSGIADPTGRPLVLASFLIDANNWPALPEPFKGTNVLLHLLNGALLCWVLLWLGRALRLDEMLARSTSLLGAAFWLLHPLLVSTTLYIVQREAMLPATFVLVGILGWIAARNALARGRTRRGLLGLLLAAWGCTALAVLCKANGALLPLLLLLIEWIVLAPNRPMPDAVLERWRRRAVMVLLVLPSVLLAVYLFASIPSSIRTATEIRDWTIWQRVLSEPRALIDYLVLLLLPHAHSSGLFNDAFPASTGLLHPWTTLPCLLAVIALVAAGFALRRKHPAIALALLFYFGAQLLESTWLPLELYYEHRNYLPALLLFWPIAIGLLRPGPLRVLKYIAAAAVLVLLCVQTHVRTTLWGDGYHQAIAWAVQNPASARAQTAAAQYDLAHNRPRLAAARLHNALADHPHDLQIPVNLIGAECELDALRPASLAAARNALATTRVGGAFGFDWFNTAIDMAARHSCAGLDFAVLQSLLDAARNNPHWRNIPGRKQDVAHLEGVLALAEAKPALALSDFNRALALEPRPDTALEQAAALGGDGFPALGLAHLDYWRTLPPAEKPDFGMPRIHAWVLRHQGYWAHETAHLRATLTSDAAARRGKPDSPAG